MILFKIVVIVFFVCFSFHYLTRKFVNPYRLFFLFGKKGCGKSTMLTKIAYQYLVQGKTVYSTEPLSFMRKGIFYSTLAIDPTKIYEYDFPRDSVILIDEVSLIWDNRDFKTMDKRIIAWFRYQRHYGVTVYLFSQNFDVDKKIRGLADDMYIVNKYLRVFTVARHMVIKPVIVHPTADAPARIDDDLVQDGLLLAPFGGCKIAFIPRWARLFDTYSPFMSSTDSDNGSSDLIDISKIRF